MPKISVVVITLNEEKNIGRCIDSVQEIADEIVVVDSFSTDRTEEICHEMGVRFIQNRFEDYVKQHEFADKQVTNNYILTLDADESLSPELVESIKNVKKYLKNDGYFMNRMTNYCGKWIKHSDWYPDKKLRLYDKTKGKWVGKKVHERFILVEGTSTGFLKGDILHYSFYTIDEHIFQANKFSTLGAQGLYESGKKVSLFRIFFSPTIKFIRNYILKLGFLDGFYGFVICRIAAFETFLKYTKARHYMKSDKGK
jgi:glycosyltransferase involved in cell wall biosynthesis